MDSLKEYVWIDWPNIDYESMPYRKSYKDSVGFYEYPVDRFGVAKELLELPHKNIVAPPIYNLSNLTNDWKDRYFSTLDSIADSVYKTAGNRNIDLLYSGGVDSTAVLIALMKNKKFKNFLKAGRFKISLTSQSIVEYDRLFFKEILPKIPIQPLDYNKSMTSNDLVVTGDLGDFIIGNSDVSYYPGVDLMGTWKVLQKQTISGEIIEKAELYLDLCNAALGHAPFEIDSCNQYLWWINQCYVYQIDLVRPYTWSTVEDLSEIGTNNKIFRFFYDQRMTTFSYEYMSTNPVYRSGDELRNFPKSYIADYTKDIHYLSKPKVYSQRLTNRRFLKNQIYFKDNKFNFKFDTEVVTCR